MKKKIALVGSGILLFVIGFLSGAVWMSNKFIGSFSISSADREEAPADYFPGETFWAYQYFGGMFTSEERLKPLPPGKGILQVRMTYEGRPAAGVGCKMYLNGKFKTTVRETDESGVLSINLPEGEWQINSIQCNSWKNKPAGEYMLALPGQRKLGRSQAEIYGELQESGKKVTVSKKAPETPQISLVLNPRVEVLWPERSGPKQGATLTKSKINWKPYPRATDYVVKFHRVTREERSTMYRPILDKKVSGETSLALKKLAHARDATAKEEYAVTVEAYDENGEFLAESQGFGGTFTLTDGNVLVEDERGYMSSASQDEVQSVYRERKILETAETLIKEKMYDQAAAVLNKVASKEMQGERYLMTGYLHASKGDCKNAKASFDEARKNGEDCIPEEYQGKCK